MHGPYMNDDEVDVRIYKCVTTRRKLAIKNTRN